MSGQYVPLPDVALSDASGVPLYLQLKKTLRQTIETGGWTEADLLPSEPAIAVHFGISRNTVRQALGELQAEGLLIRERGRGTRIAEKGPRPWAMDSWDGLFTATRAEGVALVTEPLHVAVEPLPEWAGARLGLRPGDAGLVVTRRRLIDGEVLNASTNYLPARFAPAVLGADLATNSLYELLRKEFGVTVYGANRVLDAVVLDEERAALLDAAAGEPAVLIESVVWDSGMAAFDCHQVWHRTSVMSLEVNAGGRW